MAFNNHSFAEILNRQQTDGFGASRHIPSPSNRHRPLSGGFGRPNHDRPVSSSSRSPARAPPVSNSQETPRSFASQAPSSHRNSLRSPDQLASFARHPEKRTSDISVVTQVRVATPSSQETALRTSRQASGRTTPRPNTPSHENSGEPNGASKHDSSYVDDETMGTGEQSNATTTKISGPKERVFDDRSPSAREEQDEATARARTKLANMFGSHIVNLDSSASTTHFQYSDSYNEPLGNLGAERTSPVVPPKSPFRVNSPQNAWYRSRSGHVRNSNSIDRKMHNNSVASSAQHTESENAAANSDVFSQDEAEEAYESDISSLGGDDEASDDDDDDDYGDDDDGGMRVTRVSGHGASKSLPGRVIRSSHDLPSSRAERHRDRMPAAPSTSAIYDMLTPEPKAGISSMDFAKRSPRAPAMSPASSVHTGDHSTDLSRRPPSPALSDISDAESFDSAVPPPVSLTRDSTRPKYRSAAEQKKGVFRSPTFKQSSSVKPVNKSSPNLGLSKSSTWTAAGKTSFNASADAKSQKSPISPRFRQGSITPSRSRAASRADSLPTIGFSSSSRTARSTSLSTEQSTTHTKTFNISLPSFSNIFGGFTLKNKAKKEAPPPLPPLRKITFDSRGKKQVVDLNVTQDEALDANEIAERELFGDKVEELAEPSVSRLGDRKSSIDTKRSISSQGVHANEGRSSQQGWRSREKGAPRRTAWR